MTVLLKDAIKPNLVQTLENTPAIMHGGPFANIAHGCNSVRATKTALKLGDYCITEAGFGSDLGAEKFFDIKCRFAGLKPACVVLVSTVRSMKYNGGVPKDELKEENLEALKKGSENLAAHIDNLHKFGVPVVVAINHFYADTDAEIEFVEKFCKEKGADFAVTKCFTEGGAGSEELAKKGCPLAKRKMISVFFMILMPRSMKKLILLPGKYMAQTVLNTPRKLKRVLMNLLNSAVIICLYVWLKRSTAFRIILLFWAGLTVSKSPFLLHHFKRCRFPCVPNRFGYDYAGAFKITGCV